MTDNPHRLPRTVTPSRYDLTLEPDLDRAVFSGVVTVAVEVHEPVTEVVCNAAELEIDEAWVERPDGRLDCSVRLDAGTERLVLTPSSPLPAGPCAVHVRFQGVLNDKLKGWYRSTYTAADGTTRTIATSQMQPTDCRRAFPCWDEPDLKAVFGVTLVVPADLLAVSNGPEVERRTRDDGRVAVRFGDTIPMSTYLVALVVGPLEVTEPVDVDGVPVRVVHVPGKGDLTAFSLDVASFALRWFTAFYGLDYPAEKCDLVALPDFAAGAMENLGCITFRENLLLVDPETATMAEEQVVADVICHELAHMWFGDLVTMRWWNGIWLNEAFATFMEVAACAEFRPVWRRWTSFNLERTAALEVDALRTTRSVEYPVESPEDAEGMFDVLTYEKGGALLRMLQQFLGEPVFAAGVRRYLKRHQYANTETHDLWDALEEESGQPVRRMMDGWIWQPGHPIVSVSLGNDGRSIVATQRRFTFDGADDDARWLVPVRIRQVAGDLVDERWVLLDDHRSEVPLVDPAAVVVANAGADGFYRVAYDPALLLRLTGDALASLSTSERYVLVDDTWAAVVAGATAIADFVRLAEGFAGETEVQVWQVLLNGLRWCDRLLDGTARQHFQAFVRRLVGPALERLGYEPATGEEPLTGELRGALLRAQAVLGADVALQARVRALHDRYLADPSAVDPAVAAAGAAVVAAVGTDDDYEVYLDRFRNAPTPQEQLRYLYALADFPHERHVDRTCELALSGEVKTQNAPYLLARAIANRDLGGRAWRFVRDHWADETARFPDNSIHRMVDTVKMLVDPADVADVQAFFAEHDIPQARQILQQVLERQRVNAALREREAAALAAVFA